MRTLLRKYGEDEKLIYILAELAELGGENLSLRYDLTVSPLTTGPHVYDSVQLIWCVIGDIIIHLFYKTQDSTHG